MAVLCDRRSAVGQRDIASKLDPDDLSGNPGPALEPVVGLSLGSSRGQSELMGDGALNGLDSKRQHSPTAGRTPVLAHHAACPDCRVVRPARATTPYSKFSFILRRNYWVSSLGFL
jgi:hypothetical protein